MTKEYEDKINKFIDEQQEQLLKLINAIQGDPVINGQDAQIEIDNLKQVINKQATIIEALEKRVTTIENNLDNVGRKAEAVLTQLQRFL